jgi:hypothetical protein
MVIFTGPCEALPELLEREIELNCAFGMDEPLVFVQFGQAARNQPTQPPDVEWSSFMKVAIWCHEHFEMNSCSVQDGPTLNPIWE